MLQHNMKEGVDYNMLTNSTVVSYLIISDKTITGNHVTRTQGNAMANLS